MRCDALHCGRRPYLHDDLATIQLSAALVAEPPLELWPHVAARVPIPDDVERELLLPLRDEWSKMARSAADQGGNRHDDA
jgi:hypothetical protein